MKFCIYCSAELILTTPKGDNRQRHVCQACNTVHYLNPKVVVGCILQWEDKILLCKRGINPRIGYWTLPAGFMENRESSMQGAAREAYEEARADCQSLKLYALYNLPHISQLYLLYRGNLRHEKVKVGEETLDVGLFSEERIPWAELAFPIVTESLQRYFKDRKEGHFPVHNADIFNAPGEPLDIKRHS